MKIILLIGCILLSTVMFAQFSKGDHLFSGSVGLNTNSTKYIGTAASDISKFTGVSLNLSGSTFSSNLVRNTVGFYVSHYSAKDNLTNPVTRSETSGLNYGISFSRAKLLPVAKSLYLNFPFTVSAGLQHTTSKTGLGPSENRVNGFNTSVGINAGLLYQLNKRWVLTLSLPDVANLGYSNTKNKYYVNGVLQSPQSKSSSFGFNSAIGSRLLSDLSVGFGYIIPGKK